MPHLTADIRRPLLNVLGAASLAIAVTALLSGTCACVPSRDAAPAAESTTGGVPSRAPGVTEGAVAGDDLTEAESAQIVRAYEEAIGSDTIAGIIPLAALGVATADLVVGDDTYAVADCFAVSPSADALAQSDAVDRSGVHVIYLTPDGLNAGYLGSYAELVP